jgi:hypothetical protein
MFTTFCAKLRLETAQTKLSKDKIFKNQGFSTTHSYWCIITTAKMRYLVCKPYTFS